MANEEDDFSRVGELLDGRGLPDGRHVAAGSQSESRSGAGGRSSRRTRPAAASGGRAGASPVTGSSSPDLARDLCLLWPEVVGLEAAGSSRPVRLGRGRLVVTAASTVWAQTLQFMEETIKSRLNERLGGPVVERIQFRHAGWEQQTQPTPPPVEAPGGPTGGAVPERNGGRARAAAAESRLSAEQQEALRGVEQLDLEPDLKEKIVRTMMAAFVRDQQDSVR